MPGGFARIGETQDTTAIAMQRGGHAADVWVVSKDGVERDTLLPGAGSDFRRRLPGSLPSRAAENLTWLGRYVERAEDTVRVLRAYHVRLAETDDATLPLLADVRDFMEPLGIDMLAAIPVGLLGTIDSAVYSAGQIRDRFSPDGWLALRDLSTTLHRFRRQGRAGRRCDAGDDHPAAQDRRLLRPAARKHVPLHRMALPGDRPPAGAGDPDGPHARPRDARRCAGRRARHDAGDRRQRHDPSAPIHGAIGPAYGRRPAGARPAQSALGAVPARAAEERDRPSAGRRRPWPVRTGQGGVATAHRARHEGGRRSYRRRRWRNLAFELGGSTRSSRKRISGNGASSLCNTTSA